MMCIIEAKQLMLYLFFNCSFIILFNPCQCFEFGSIIKDISHLVYIILLIKYHYSYTFVRLGYNNVIVVAQWLNYFKMVLVQVDVQIINGRTAVEVAML